MSTLSIIITMGMQIVPMKASCRKPTMIISGYLELYLEFIFRTDDYTSFWLKHATKYPNIWKDIKLYLLAFPTSYLVEKGYYNMYHGQKNPKNHEKTQKTDNPAWGVSSVQMVNADKSLRREISKPQDIRDLFVSRFKHMGTPKVVNDTKVPTKSPGKHDEPMNDRESITRVGIDNTPVMGFTSKESSLQDEHTDKPTDENTDEHTTNLQMKIQLNIQTNLQMNIYRSIAVMTLKGIRGLFNSLKIIFFFFYI